MSDHDDLVGSLIFIVLITWAVVITTAILAAYGVLH